jgi:hypothetical protein
MSKDFMYGHKSAAAKLQFVKISDGILYQSENLHCGQILLCFNQRNETSTQHIINSHYSKCLFPLLDLTTNSEANACLALPNACRRLVHALFLL